MKPSHQLNVFWSRCLKPSFQTYVYAIMHQNIQCYSQNKQTKKKPHTQLSLYLSQAEGSHHTAKAAAKRINTSSRALHPQPSFSLLIFQELSKSWFKQLSAGKDLGEDGEKVRAILGEHLEKKFPLGIRYTIAPLRTSHHLHIILQNGQRGTAPSINTQKCLTRCHLLN